MSKTVTGTELSRVGPYRVIELIGAGGMGRVYRAEHLATGQAVALKTANHLSAARMLALRMEITALRAVSHAGVVQILDQGVESGVPWYAMELLVGQTLADYQRDWLEERGHVTESQVTRTAATSSVSDRLGGRGARAGDAPSAQRLEDVLQLYRRLCEPLAHIHARGMVHRDLKPTNVFVQRDGRVVLMDFGLLSYATGAVGREVLDAGERALGTVRYLAPERIEGKQVDARADLYALGCMLYESATGRAPFDGAPQEVLVQHVSREPVPPSRWNPELPAALEALILSLLVKKPAERVGRAVEVSARLDRCLGQVAHPLRTTSAALLRPELSGRDDVLAELHNHAQTVRAGACAVVVLRGESGIGKTFIASEFAAQAGRAGFRVVTAECVPAAIRSETARARSEPLRPLARLLQALADRCRERAVAAQRLITHAWAASLLPFEPALADFTDESVLGAPLPGAAGRERIVGSLIEALNEYDGARPMLLVIDDLQWADELTIAFLERLSEGGLKAFPLLVLATLRSNEAPEELSTLLSAKPVAQLSIAQLQPTAAARMIGDMLGVTEPQADIVSFVLGRSRGNPFFVAECLRYLVSGGYLTREGQGPWQLSQQAVVPVDSTALVTHVEALLVRRLHTLDDEVRNLVSSAAVIGRQFQSHVLAFVLDADERDVVRRLPEAEALAIIERAGEHSYRFAHDKVHEAAYAMVHRTQLAELHGRAANALSHTLGRVRGEDSWAGAAEVARHFELAGELAKALEYYERAGDEAVAKSAGMHAAGAFRAAIQLAQLVHGVGDVRRARWERELGAALYDSSDFARGSEHLHEALRLLGRPAPRKDSLALPVSLAHALATQLVQRVRALRPGPARARAADDAPRLLEAARAFDRLQQGFYYTGEGLPMLHACLCTLNLAEAAGPSPELIVAYANAAAVAGILPARSLVAVYERRALETMGSFPNAVAQTYHHVLSGVYLTGIAAWPRAQAILETGLAAAKKLRYARRTREFIGATGILHYLRGEFDRAKVLADELLSIAVREDAQNHSWALLSRTQAQLAQGVFGGSMFADVRAAQELMPALGKPELAWCSSLSAVAHARTGDLAKADELSQLALDTLRALPPVTHYTIDAAAQTAELRVRLMHAARARERKRELQVSARQALRVLAAYARVFPVAQTRYELIRGQLLMGGQRVQRGRARKHFRASLVWAQRLAMPYDEARARLALAATLRQRERASEERLAHAILDTLGVVGTHAALSDEGCPD